MRVAACLVTRGDVPMDDILESIPPEWEIVLWDNSVREDLGVYGRYAAIDLTDAELIYVQDDDAVLTVEDVRSFRSERMPPALIANMPAQFHKHYTDSCLVGFGAIFWRDYPQRAFDLIDERPDDFNLTCDVYFTTLTQPIWRDVPYRDQPWASDSNRMWKQPEHVPMRAAALENARRIRRMSGIAYNPLR